MFEGQQPNYNQNRNHRSNHRHIIKVDTIATPQQLTPLQIQNNKQPSHLKQQPHIQLQRIQNHFHSKWNCQTAFKTKLIENFKKKEISQHQQSDLLNKIKIKFKKNKKLSQKNSEKHSFSLEPFAHQIEALNTENQEHLFEQSRLIKINQQNHCKNHSQRKQRKQKNKFNRAKKDLFKLSIDKNTKIVQDLKKSIKILQNQQKQYLQKHSQRINQKIKEKITQKYFRKYSESEESNSFVCNQSKDIKTIDISNNYSERYQRNSQEKDEIKISKKSQFRQINSFRNPNKQFMETSGRYNNHKEILKIRKKIFQGIRKNNKNEDEDIAESEQEADSIQNEVDKNYEGNQIKRSKTDCKEQNQNDYEKLFESSCKHQKSQFQNRMEQRYNKIKEKYSKDMINSKNLQKNDSLSSKSNKIFIVNNFKSIHSPKQKKSNRYLENRQNHHLLFSSQLPTSQQILQTYLKSHHQNKHQDVILKSIEKKTTDHSKFMDSSSFSKNNHRNMFYHNFIDKNNKKLPSFLKKQEQNLIKKQDQERAMTSRNKQIQKEKYQQQFYGVFIKEIPLQTKKSEERMNEDLNTTKSIKKVDLLKRNSENSELKNICKSKPLNEWTSKLKSQNNLLSSSEWKPWQDHSTIHKK